MTSSAKLIYTNRPDEDVFVILTRTFFWVIVDPKSWHVSQLLQGKPCTLRRWSHRSKLFKITFWTTFISIKTLYHWNWMRRFWDFLKTMVKNTKIAITFFPMGGFLGILDMLFHATWPTIGVNAAWLTFFSTLCWFFC